MQRVAREWLRPRRARASERGAEGAARNLALAGSQPVAVS